MPLLRTPKEWIERKLEQTSPELSGLTLDKLASDYRHRESRAEAEPLQCDLLISYFPDSMEKLAGRWELSGETFLQSLLADLREGVTVQKSHHTKKDGSVIVCLFGTRWQVWLWSKRARDSGATLAVLDGAKPIEIPTRQARYRPESVEFRTVKDESPCDVEHLLEQFQACKRRSDSLREEARDLRRRLQELDKRRQDAFDRIAPELQRGQVDVTVQIRTASYAKLRQSYSALEVMMQLLHKRSELDTKAYAGVVIEADLTMPAVLSLEQANLVEKNGLLVRLSSSLPSGKLEEETLIELESAANSRPRHARVVAVEKSDGQTIVRLNLSADFLRPGSTVAIHTVSRFGMWAHQGAMQTLFDEKVQGHWLDLVRLLCAPAELTVPAGPSSTIRFFCDSDPESPPLNDRQRVAVAGALATPHAFCIQGPPGTGKTTVICELIQQLLARGERILFVAPTHVAVDEVLSRIGSRPGVRALRLSWDETRVAEGASRYLPSRLVDPFIERLQRPPERRSADWQRERDELAAATAPLTALVRICRERIAWEERLKQAEAAQSQAVEKLDVEQVNLRAEISDGDKQIAGLNADVKRLNQSVRSAIADHKQTRSQAGWAQRALGAVGLGEIARSAKAQRTAEDRLARKTKKRDEVERDQQAAEAKLAKLQAAVSTAMKHTSAATSALGTARQEEQMALKACRMHEILRDRSLAADSLQSVVTELRERDDRLAGYQKLAQNFSELVGNVREQGENSESLKRDLLAVTNLFCCTTTGVASREELRDLAFDTLIVDEASRVTDSEFLISATRAKRWILVGDEKQLPPYVEQSDEQFIHALSALHRSESGGIELEQAVDELGSLWDEDEELHQFRRDGVQKAALELRDSGAWASYYRVAYQGGIQRLRQEVDDPSRELLRAMRENLIHSLFERVVAHCPPALRVPLVEQRRMIQPLAEIVSAPIYGGNYATPASEVLAALKSPVVPLTTGFFRTPVTFLDTSQYGLQARDKPTEKGNGFENPFEADWIVQACVILDDELKQTGARAGSVSVSILVFYKAQSRLIREKLDRVELRRGRFFCLRFAVIDAIDRIQGQESDVVILGFCRTAGKSVSPTFGQWLQDVRRLNVACTRAHRALIFVGQKELLGKLCSNPQAQAFYQHLNELFGRHKAFRVVSQLGKN